MKKILLLLCIACVTLNLYASKKANLLWLFLETSKSSVMYDQDVSVDYYFGGPFGYYVNTNPYVIITITNNTDSIIYIDLGNSYLLRNQNPRILYSQNVKIQSNSDISASSLNLGIIGISDGSIQTKATINTQERICVLPPHSKKKIMELHIFDDGETIDLSPYGTLRYKTSFFNNPTVVQEHCNNVLWYNSQFMVGDIVDYSEEDTPLTLKFSINYFLNEHQKKNASSQYYVRKVVGSRGMHVGWTEHNIATKDKKTINKVYPQWSNYSGLFFRVETPDM